MAVWFRYALILKKLPKSTRLVLKWAIVEEYDALMPLPSDVLVTVFHIGCEELSAALRDLV